MIFFGILVACFLATGFIVGAFIASEARARGRFGELIGSGVKGGFLAAVAVVVMLAIGACTCSLLPKNATSYSSSEEVEFVQAEFEGSRCYIWYVGENGNVEKLITANDNTTVTRATGVSPSVMITRTYDDIVGLMTTKADITVSEGFIFEGDPDA